MLGFTNILVALAFASSAIASPIKRATGVYIRPGNNDAGLCLAVIGTPANGAGVTTTACSNIGNSTFGLWDIVDGDQQGIKLTGTNFCLDAGENPGPQTPGVAKLWQCLTVPQQRWFYTGPSDQHIAITGGNTCLTYGRYGVFTSGCAQSTGAGSQLWIYEAPGGGNTPPPDNPPPTGGRRIYWNGDQTKCLTVNNGALSNGQGVTINTCFATDNADSRFQRWEINRGAGAIKVQGTNYCLDAGTAPGNGVMAKIWQCYDGLAAQNWYYTAPGDDHIALTGNTVCLDVRAESGPQQNKPYGSLKDVQQWQCAGGNGNQIFTI